VTRQYFPEGMNVREISDKILAIAVKKINHRPRKCLDYQTPHEVYYQALRGTFAT
jgi:IS30 family transposase